MRLSNRSHILHKKWALDNPFSVDFSQKFREGNLPAPRYLNSPGSERGVRGQFERKLGLPILGHSQGNGPSEVECFVLALS